MNCKKSRRLFYWLCIPLLFSMTATAQQPGGVEGTKLWYLTEKRGNRYVFKDISGHIWKAYDSSASFRNFNFHPVFKNGTGQGNPLSLPNFAFNQATVIGLFYPSGNNNINDTYLFQTAFDGGQTKMRLNRVDTASSSRNFDFASVSNRTNFRLDPPHTVLENAMKTGVYFMSSPKNYTSIWEEDKTTSLAIRYDGYLPELIIYNRILSPLERVKVETYLAIKYGTTPDTSYVSSDGRLLWNYTQPLFRKFHNRVCAIGKDTKAGIRQPKSNTSYEEKPYPSYDNDADVAKIASDWKFIPEDDHPSLYRSVTIGYHDTTMNSLQEGEFLFWGDNAESVQSKNYIPADTTLYPGLKLVKRKWLLHNPANASRRIRMVIAGKGYKDSTLFSNLYKPYDYQNFTFVLVRIDSTQPGNIDTTILCDYFGREEERNNIFHFNTKTLVWDSLFWSPSSSTVFTLGKAPLLNFLNVWQQGTAKIKLGFPYDNRTEIRTGTLFDTVRLQYRDTAQRVFFFDVNEGVKPMMPVLFRVDSVTKALIRMPANSITLASAFNPAAEPPGPATPESETTDDDEIATPEPVDNTVPRRIDYISRVRKTKEQKPRPVGYAVRFPQLNSVYVVVVTDRINQRTVIPVKITKK